MADVRCPMCGKSNPADQAVCKFCGARLRPVWESGQEQAPDNNLPDWLTGLGGASDQPSLPDENVPDWLSGLRGEAGGESGAPEQGGPARPQEVNPPDADASGWLKNIISDSGFTGDDESAARPLDDLPEDSDDWLSRIGGSQGTPAPFDQTPDTNRWDIPGQDAGVAQPAWPEEGETDLPDWLRPTPPAASERPAEPEEMDWGIPRAEETPDWLKGMSDELPAEEPAPPADEELPDWLRSGAQAAPPASQPAGAQDFDTPDWLKAMDATPGEPAEAQPADVTSPAGGDELPDWLKFASEESPEAGRPEPDAEVFGTPDWLAGLGAQAGEPAEAEAAQPADVTSPAGGDDLPDWLKFASQESPEAGQPEPDAQVFGTPDWMAGLGAETGEPAGAEPAQPADWMAPATGGELPDWLASAAGEVEAAETAGEAQEFDATDWLSQPASAAEGEPHPAGEENGMLAWLSAMESETPAKEPVSAAPEEAPAGSDLSWLDELESTYSGLAVESDQPSSGSDALTIGANVEEGGQLEQGSLPAWLMGTGFEEEPEAEAGAAEEDDSLKVEALPSWLQAMRPVGAPSALEPETPGETTSQPVEGAGPLAGLRGVLPAEPDISQVGKPPMYTVRLQVSEAQEVQAKMLSDLLEAEVQPRAVPERPILTSRTLLRVVVALVLILALLAPILTGQPVFLPPAVPGEVSGVRSLVTGLPAGSRVLVAVDYDPGFSAEMDGITRAVLVDILDRGAVPVIASTTATGPIQAERLIGQARAAGTRTLVATENYINLGFVPGGTMGLASFVQAPGKLLPYDLTGVSAWSSTALQGIDSLADFGLILVATESPDRARAWIEQIYSQEAMLPTVPPVVMLVSAQAGPLVRPYYDASPRQVQGMVTGLSGALSYETLAGQPGTAGQFWSPFNFGSGVAVALMVLGALFNLIARRLPARRGPQEVEKA